MQLTEPEKQVLIGLKVISRRDKPTREMLDKSRKLIFDDELLEWGRTLDELIERGIINETDGVLSLSDGIRVIADRLQRRWSSRGFSEWLIKSEKSQTYSEFCRRLYGLDLCQCSMTDKRQLDFLLKTLKLNKDNRVLDVGCGIGVITEFISDATGAHVTGVDFAAGAIDRARRRTVRKKDRLRYKTKDMEALRFEPGSFDTVIAIDSLYFTEDLDRLVKRLVELVEPGGQMGIFYSPIIPPEQSKFLLQPGKTKFAAALKKADKDFRYWDFSRDEADIWKNSKAIAEDLKEAFTQEGYADLYESRIKESERQIKVVAEGRTRRYLYHVTL